MRDLLLINPINGSHKEFRAYTRFHAKSFYFFSFLLPKEKRYAAYSVFTFCRFTNKIIDLAKNEDGKNVEKKLNALRNFLDDVYSVNVNNKLSNTAFLKTVKKFDIPREYFFDLIDGVSMKINNVRYKTFHELENYCYKVASVVGLIMTKIFGYAHTAALSHAVSLGKAIQLTNILRDIHEDYLIGRIYLPEDEMGYFQYSREDIKNKIVDSNFIALMKFQIERTRGFYELALRGIPYLPDDGSRTTVVLMYKTYSGILDEIEKHGYDIYSELRYVSTIRKIKMTGKYFFSNKERKKFSNLPKTLPPKSNSPFYIVGE